MRKSRKREFLVEAEMEEKTRVDAWWPPSAMRGKVEFHTRECGDGFCITSHPCEDK